MPDLLRAHRDALTREALLAAVAEAVAELDRACRARPGLGPQVAGWRRRLEAVPRRLAEGEARIAFVGAVKSGKSTLVNALLGEDLLPRGSGVLTAQATAVRQAVAPAVHLLWKGRTEVNRELRRHLEALGHPAPLDLWNDSDRATLKALVRGPHASPHAAPVGALLRGFAATGSRLAATRTPEPRPGLADLGACAARDEVAGYLARVEVDLPAAGLPPGIVLLDCPGSDAWNAAHDREVEETLLAAHALVYVVGSRVGLRAADMRALARIRAYGLADLVRFVVNVDLGEIRHPDDLARVLDGTAAELAAQGFRGAPHAFSALQGLLDRRLLLAPGTVSPGERRLLAAWDDAPGAAAARSRDAWVGFRDALWREVSVERDRLVIGRARSEFLQVLVEATRVLDAGGHRPGEVGGAAWRAETADTLLAWLREGMAEAAEAARARLDAGLDAGFAARRAPQRRAWSERVAGLAAGAPADDPLAAGPLPLARRAEDLLTATEPLRVNAVRNLALAARGQLARSAEALAAEAARTLTAAGVACGAPPNRGGLSREISVTRKIPLFRGRLGAAADTGGSAGALRRAGARLLGPGRAARAQGAARRSLLLRRMASLWQGYCDELTEHCLHPHVEEAAAQLLDALAAWVLTQIQAGRRPTPPPTEEPR